MCRKPASRRRPTRWVRFSLVSLLLGAWLVMLLWNALGPELLGWSRLGYWQAFGLLLLVRVLIGWLLAMRGRCAQATPEEKQRWRAAFAEKMDKHCQHRSQPQAKRPDDFEAGFTGGKWSINVIDVEDQDDPEKTNPDGDSPDQLDRPAN